MKAYLTIITIFSLSLYSSVAQSLFNGPIKFKGKSEGVHFSGRDFDIDFEGDVFKIFKPKKGGREFVVEYNKSGIRDVVFSSSHTTIAVAMRASDLMDPQRALVTVDATGKKRVFKYQSRKMTERLGWVIELGAVSDNGELLLAKCALMLPSDKDGVSYVRHEWVVLSISNGSIKIIDSTNAIDKWSDYGVGS